MLYNHMYIQIVGNVTLITNLYLILQKKLYKQNITQIYGVTGHKKIKTYYNNMICCKNPNENGDCKG